MHLRIAIDYSARDAIIQAARRFRPHIGLEPGSERAGFGRLLGEAMYVPEPATEDGKPVAVAHGQILPATSAEAWTPVARSASATSHAASRS